MAGVSLQRAVSLEPYNTLGFVSVAEYFCTVETEQDLIEAITEAERLSVNWQVLGGGSNVLMAQAVAGLTLHMASRGIEVIEHEAGKVELIIAAGENWHDLVAWSVEQGFAGIESMALIPGTVGAAPVQNIGAYGTEIADVLSWVRAYDSQQQEFVTLAPEACQFGYRDSLFKRQSGRFVITQVAIELQRAQQSCARYAALASYFESQGIIEPSIGDVFQGVCAVRRSKLPDPSELGNAGSFFKNPVVSQEKYAQLKQDFPYIVGYPQAGEVKLAAGWLIDQCGWKGKRQGPVGVYAKQALVLVHFGGGCLSDLEALYQQIQASVFDTFAVALEPEPQPFPLLAS